MQVHRVLGPGFLQALYQAALEHESTLRAIPCAAQKKLKVTYKSHHYLAATGLRLALLHNCGGKSLEGQRIIR